VRYSVHANTIGRWRREFAVYQEAAFPGNGNAILTEEQKENQRLRKQLREAELANEILKKALGIISSPSGKNFLL
jgi:transposase